MMRQQLLQDAYDEMERFQQKYGHLKELSEVILSMRKISTKKVA